MGLFGKSTFLDGDVEAWLIETWRWLMANLGGMWRLRHTPLVLASREFFPPTDAQGHELALYVFGRISSLMGMADRPVNLEPIPSLEAAERLAKPIEASAAVGADSPATIPYDPEVLHDARRLIAMLAYELARCLVLSVKAPPPGGEGVFEMASEVAVAYAGFGIFGANACLSLSPSTGRRAYVAHHGFLSEEAHAFALALFVRLKEVEIPPGQLRDNMADLTLKALRYLERNPALSAPLRQIA